MNLELFVYPFIVAAIYFEAFLLVTFLSAPARASRARSRVEHTPTVAMVVPCYNEETTIRGTVDSLLALDYPKDKLHIYLVNDGSTDSTRTVMETFAPNPQVTVINKENGGKHSGLNAGLEAAMNAELVGCLDADSFVDSGALRAMIPCFDNPKVGAATAAMSVHKPKNLLEQMQNAEYILGIALRHILAAVNGIYVTPGPFSIYRRELLVSLGGFRNGHNAEDMEMALRIQRAGFHIDSAHTARVYTTAPRSVPSLVKQRVRWTTGFLRNMLYDYRDLIGNPRYGALGLIVLPLGFMAIVGGVVIFFLALFQVTAQLTKAYILTEGVPLHYTLTNAIPSLSIGGWFYLPITMFALLSLLAALGSIIFIMVGKRISQTPGKLDMGLVGYMLIYCFLAPFWLIRSIIDVATGVKRSWR